MEDPAGTLQEIHRLARAMREHLPEMKAPYNALNEEVYKDGALKARNKRLMALCVAVTHGCTGCMLFQLQQALESGASLEEVLETLAVSVALGGSMASSKAAQVMAYLEQKKLV